MKKRLAAVLAGTFVFSLLTGCAASKGLETDDLKITQYKNIEVDQVEKPEEITDKDVEDYIQSILELNPDMEEITDRAAQDGDTVNIDYVGKIDGEEFEGGSNEGYPLTLGSGSFIDGFEDSIIGHNIGDTFDWNGKFPDNYNEEYAGKEVVFTITVNSISEPKIPELTDDYVKGLSEKSKTVKEYKKEIKDKLTKEAETEYNDQLSSEVWEAVLDNSEVKKYPEDELKELTDKINEQYKSAAESEGMEFAEFLEQYMQMTEEDFAKQVDEATKASVKQTMIVEAIADKEKIKLDDEAYKKQLKVIAEAYGYEDVDALKEAAEEEDLKDIALYNLVKDWLTEHCIQKAK